MFRCFRGKWELTKTFGVLFWAPTVRTPMILVQILGPGLFAAEVLGIPRSPESLDLWDPKAGTIHVLGALGKKRQNKGKPPNQR